MIILLYFILGFFSWDDFHVWWNFVNQIPEKHHGFSIPWRKTHFRHHHRHHLTGLPLGIPRLKWRWTNRFWNGFGGSGNSGPTSFLVHKPSTEGMKWYEILTPKPLELGFLTGSKFLKKYHWSYWSTFQSSMNHREPRDVIWCQWTWDCFCHVHGELRQIWKFKKGILRDLLCGLVWKYLKIG